MSDTAAVRAQPFRHKVQLVQAWRCTDCGSLFHPDWPSDDEPCPAHARAAAKIREVRLVDWGPDVNGMGEIQPPTELVRCPCAKAGCEVVGVGRTWEDARRALYLDHAKGAGHAIPDA